MEQVHLDTAQNVAIDMEVAGIGDRVLAAMVDYFVLACYLVFLSALSSTLGVRAIFLVGLVPFLTYFLLMEVFFDGQSIGKRLLHIRVVRIDGGAPTLGGYLLRWLLRFLDVELSSGMVGVVTILVNGKGQRLGDLAAGTTVVRVRPRVHLRDTLLARIEPDYTPVFDVSPLSEEDLATVRAVYNTLLRDGRSRATLRIAARTKAALEKKLGITSDLPPAAFLQTVLKDYNAAGGGR